MLWKGIYMSFEEKMFEFLNWTYTWSQCVNTEDENEFKRIDTTRSDGEEGILFTSVVKEHLQK